MGDKSQNDLMKEAVELLKEQARQQMAMNNSLDGYLENLKKLRSIHETVNANRKIEQQLQDKLQKAALAGDMKLVREERLKLKILKQQTAELELQGKELAEQVKQVNTSKLAIAKMGASLVKGFGNLPNLIENSFGKLKGYGVFDMDKAMKKSALSMGVLSKQSTSFRTTIVEASNSTNEIGIGIEQLAQMQGEYSNELGRTVTLSQSGLKAMGDMAAASGLGAEGTAKMAADMENQGISAERTAGYVEQTMNDAHKMGLNASKVIKNIQNNMKLLNKYNFKGGVKGLAKMAETTTKLGVDMNFVSSMADKLFDIEGAVDMSSQLQVMGGEWSKLADPFKLMYMARNDMEGLTEAMGQAAASSAHFNKESGEFEISALEMHRLRKIAEQTGVSYEELATAGKNAAKFSKIKSQMSIDVGGDKDLKEFITNTAQLDKNGKATIMIDGNPKLLSQLTDADKKLLKQQVLEKQTLNERAKDARTFDDALTNTLNLFKTALLPLVETLNKNLIPKIDSFVKRIKEGGWLEKIGDIAKFMGNIVSKVGGWVIDNPIKTLIGIGLFKASQWVLNGIALAKGFKMGGGVSSSGSSGGGSDFLGGKSMRVGAKLLQNGKLAKGASVLAKGLGKANLALSLLDVGIDGVTNAMDENLSVTDKFLKTLDQHKGMAAGAAIGSFIPGVGTIIGAGIGGLVDMFTGEIGTYGDGANDAIFNSPIHDGISKGLGSDFNKNRGIIQGGKITPIDNKDDLIAYKPNGPIDNTIKGDASSMKIEFGEIHFKFDELKVTSPGSPGVAVDLLKDPQFIRNITKLINVETNKAITGGKISPSPR